MVTENPMERLFHPQKDYQKKPRKKNISKATEQTTEEDVLEKLENSLSFRQKRYRFLKMIQQHRTTTLDALHKLTLANTPTIVTGGMNPSRLPSTGPRSSFPSPENYGRPVTSSSRSSRSDITKLDLHRASILSDFWRYLQPWIQPQLHSLPSLTAQSSPSDILRKDLNFKKEMKRKID